MWVPLFMFIHVTSFPPCSSRRCQQFLWPVHSNSRTPKQCVLSINVAQLLSGDELIFGMREYYHRWGVTMPQHIGSQCCNLLMHVFNILTSLWHVDPINQIKQLRVQCSGLCALLGTLSFPFILACKWEAKLPHPDTQSSLIAFF